MTDPLSLIVAMDKNRAIGRGNDLPWHIPADLKRFKALTTGHPVIMGRKTFQSIESRLKKPLPDRPNFVVSRAGFSYPGVDVFPDLETAVSEARHEFPQDEIFIIGGASIYEQAVPLATRIYLTLVDLEVPDADAWFPEIPPAAWMETAREDIPGDPAFHFVTLERR